MRLIKCYNCNEIKQEIEFEYLYLKKRYKSKCKECDEKQKQPIIYMIGYF